MSRYTVTGTWRADGEPFPDWSADELRELICCGRPDGVDDCEGCGRPGCEVYEDRESPGGWLYCEACVLKAAKHREEPITGPYGPASGYDG